MDPEENEEVKKSTVPSPADVEVGDGADHPLEAVKVAEENGLGPNQTIVGTFTAAEKDKLLKMIKHKEFNPIEGAVLKALMSEELTLDELGVMLGAKSEKTKGQPMSKVAALKELNRILAVVAKRSKAKLGRAVDLTKIKAYRAEIKRQDAERRKKAAEAKKKAKAAQKEFWQLLSELNKEQRKHGLKPTRYDLAYTGQGEYDKRFSK